MSSISIVIPMLGSLEDFENTLASVLRHRLDRHQVIVVHGQTDTDRYGLADEVDFVCAEGRPVLARYVNRGLESAREEIVNLIRPGVDVTQNWFLYAVRALQEKGVASAIPLIVQSTDRQQPMVAGIRATVGMNRKICFSAKGRPLGPSSWAAFYRRAVLQLVGPLDESLCDEYMDLDLALSLRKLRQETRFVPESVLTVDSRTKVTTSFSRVAGRDAQRMIRRHADQSSRATFVRTTWGVASDLAVSCVCPTRIFRFLGRTLANSKRATDRAFVRQLSFTRREMSELGLELGQPVPPRANKRAA